MDELARAHYASIYAVLYFGAICAVALWEAAAPRRALTAPLRLRWFGNLSVTLLQSAVTWWLFPMASVGFAILAAERGWGVLRLVDVPYPVAFVLSLALFDLSRYAQHRAQHRVPLLWRLHRMHHTDHDLDFTTGLRFHPLEALLTTSIAFCVVTALGAPVAAVAAYEACFVLSVMFAHGNIRIPERVDTPLRFTSLGAGRLATCGAEAGGDLYCWGRFHPLRVSDRLPPSDADIHRAVRGEQFRDVATGWDYACGITLDGRLLCW